MIRVVLPVFVPFLAVALAAVWVLGPPAPLAARFRPADCRQIVLVDAETGRDVTGAEDIVLAPDGDTLIFAAQDRLQTERAAGGLYAISLWGLAGTGDRATARPLLGPRAAADPFRPQGIALSPDGTRLAVVNRVRGGEGAIEIGTLGPDGWRPDRRIADRRLCRANDLEFDGAAGPEVLRVTLDRADCTTSVRDLIGGTGSVARIDGDRLTIERSGLNFPNGIAGDWIAETRSYRLVGPAGPVSLPGGPDNLGAAGDRLITALHPNLVRTGLYLAGWLDRLSSRIVAVHPRTGAVEVLYDDAEGAQFSGATVGVLTGNRLVAGSVRDAGVLYCEAPG